MPLQEPLRARAEAEAETIETSVKTPVRFCGVKPIDYPPDLENASRKETRPAGPRSGLRGRSYWFQLWCAFNGGSEN